MNQTYNGHEIQVTKEMRFDVVGEDRNFASYLEATEFIDKIAKVKQSKAKEKLSLEVLTESGTVEHITGVHMNKRSFLGISKIRELFGERTQDVYPNVPWVKLCLARFKQLNDELGTLKKQLDTHEIRLLLRYGRIDPEDYQGVIDALKVTHANKLKAALDLANPKE